MTAPDLSRRAIDVVTLTATPQVNLLPPELAAAERFRRVQAAMGGAVLLAVVIVGAVYVHERQAVSGAKSQLASAQSQNGSLQATVTSLAGVRATYNAVQTEQALFNEATAQEVRWSYVLNDLALRIPNNVWLTSVQASQSTAATTGTTTTPGVAPAAANQIGTVTFDGVGFRHDDVANWLDALAKINGFAGPSFSRSTESAIGSHGVVLFTTSVNVTPGALWHHPAATAGQ